MAGDYVEGRARGHARRVDSTLVANRVHRNESASNSGIGGKNRIKYAAAPVDHWLLTWERSALNGKYMADGIVYYCWSCDAHRRALHTSVDGVACSQCGERLTADALVSVTYRPPVGLGGLLLQLTKSGNAASPAA
jgi:DNA-directed RNA polymerase subunit RPC12/RpoP